MAKGPALLERTGADARRFTDLPVDPREAAADAEAGARPEDARALGRVA